MNSASTDNTEYEYLSACGFYEYFFNLKECQKK